MPTATIELPREMLIAAERYAENEHRTVVDLLADLMYSRYGFSFSKSQAHQDLTVDRKKSPEIPDVVKSISGILSDSKDDPDSDLLYDAIMTQ